MNTHSDNPNTNPNELPHASIDGIEKYFKLPETADYDFMVSTFIKQKDTAPFDNVSVNENASIDVDIDDDFYDTTTSIFGDKHQAIIEDYFGAMLKTFIDNVDDIEAKVEAEAETEKDTNDSK